MRCIYGLIVLVFWFLLLCPSSSKGQRRGSPSIPSEKIAKQKTPRIQEREIYERVDILRASYLRQELLLPEEKVKALLEKMRYRRQLRERYLFRRYTIENELNTLLDYSSPDQAKINHVLQKLETIERQYYQEIMEAHKELRKMLTPEEFAKYVLFERDFNRKLKKVISNIQQQKVSPPTQSNQP
jgi:hypothetical protein